ncbi:pilus assembly protein PilM [Anaerosporobacter faecicola]|uniref:pilus assembly protein PilM n=1 Tax=Anaerosporobacter faecicola TaxID=2718714 RepID=UPI001438F1C8|nr:pilus assembly protein PilM [Anaerosporobacter faecicola]
MGNKVLAIEIGEKLVRICETNYNQKNIHIYNEMTIETPMGLVEDGYVREKVALSKLIKEKLSIEKITNRKVVFTIASNKIASREVIVPQVKKQQIKQLVQSNASDYFPIKIDEYTIAYSILDTEEGKDKKIRLLVVAVPNEIVKSYYDLAELLGFTILNMDFAGNSSYQLFKQNDSKETSMVVHLNDNNGYITILNQGHMVLQRTIPYGSSNIINTVMNNPVLEVKTYETAVELIRKNLVDVDLVSYEGGNKVNVIGEEVAVTAGNVAYQETYEVVHNIVNNIMRILDYYTSKNEGNPVKAIYLASDGLPLKYLYDLLEKHTGVKVLQYDKFIASSSLFNNSIDTILLGRYLACVGAIINSTNIEKAKVEEKKENRVAAQMTALFFGVCIIVSTGLSVKSYMDYNGLKEDKKEIENNIQQLEGIVDIYKEYNTTTSLYNQYTNIYSKTVGNNDILVDVIKALEEKLPTKARIEALDVTDSSVVLNLETDRKEIIAKTINSLRECECFCNVTNFGFIEETDENGLTSIKYTVECFYGQVNQEIEGEN